MIFAQSVLGTFYWRETAREFWLALIAQTVLLGFLWYKLRKRNSLWWRATQMARALREPKTVDVWVWLIDVVTLQRFHSVLLLWLFVVMIIGVACAPIHQSSSSNPSSSYLRELLLSAHGDFFAIAWQIQATFLGFFVVLITILLQLISLKRQYESALLPFVAQKIAVVKIIVINFLITMVLHPYIAIEESALNPSLIRRYLAVAGLAFTVISILFLLLRLLEFLKEEAIEANLSELAWEEIVDELKDEQIHRIAEHILDEECNNIGIEYDSFDFNKNLASIRPIQTGTITDLNLKTLAHFAGNLREQTHVQNESPRRAILLRTIGDELTLGNDNLARVAPADNSEKNQTLLRRVFKVKKDKG